jgi:hypothetical protein
VENFGGFFLKIGASKPLTLITVCVNILFPAREGLKSEEKFTGKILLGRV